jgi:hypothetical protein
MRTEPTARIPTGPTATTPTATARTGPTATGPTARASDRAFPHLSELVGREAVAAFLDERFGRDAFRTRLAPAAAQALFGWERLNRALAEHRFAPPRLRLERAGQDATRGLFGERRTRRGAALVDLDATTLMARLREGATLILDAANEASPPLQRLCAGLAAEFGCACQANLYACWGETQGFDVHWDDHDVFVVQVEGRKRWALYGATRAHPTRRDLHGEHERPERPIEETVLAPGDVLYLPRGYWHAAVGMGEPSLHLTIGLTRKTGADFLQWLGDHFIGEALVRADLPLERDDAALGARIAELVALAAGAEPEALARAYRRRVQATQARRPQLSFPYIGAEGLDPGAWITLADGAASLAPGPAGAVVLTWRGTAFTVAEALAGPLAALAEGRAVALADLEAAVPGAERALVAPFVAEMVRRGAFVVAAGPRA